MKKIKVIIYLFLLSVPVFSAENIPFRENITETGDLITCPGITKSNILIPTAGLIDPFRISSAEKYKSFELTPAPGLLDLNYRLLGTESQEREKPPSNLLRIAGEIGMGLLGVTVAASLSLLFLKKWRYTTVNRQLQDL